MNQTNPAPTAPKHQRSLRWSLILFILLCWVLPILFAVTFGGISTSRRTHVHVADIVTASLENSVDTVQRDLENLIHVSFNATYVPTIRNAYSQYWRDDNMPALHTAVTTFLQQEYSRNSLSLAAYLLFPELSSQRFYTFNRSTYENALATAFYSSDAPGKALAMLPALDTDIGFFEDNGHLYMVRQPLILNNRFQPYSLLVIDIDQDVLFENLRTQPLLTDITLYINIVNLDLAGQPVGPDDVRQDSALQNTFFPKPTVMISGRTENDRFTLQYYARADLQPLLRQQQGPILVLVVMGFLIIPLIAGTIYFFYRKVTNPIAKLSGFAGRIEDGQFGTQINTRRLGSPDFANLGTQLNAMSARLQDQFDRIYREELALRDARIKALQSQINPHFLGNTLEIINWEARLAGDVKVSAMLESLSTMLEAALDRRHRPLVHLSEEMMYVNAYLHIIKERLGKRLSVKVDIDPHLQDWHVPRLILQPIVENAIDHGIATRQRGTVTIRAVRKDEEWMELQVVNDAPLLPEDEERIQQLLADEQDVTGEPSANIGIRNVHQRLRILYGPSSGLSIKNDKNGNTISSMCIQVYQESQENAR